MKKYLVLGLTILVSILGFAGQTFATTALPPTITSVTATGSNTGYVSAAGSSTILVSGFAAPDGAVDSTVTIFVTNANNTATTSALVFATSSFQILVDGHTLSDGTLHVYAMATSTSSTTPSTLAATTVIKDIISPTITSTGPTNGATGVPISSFINANFSENMAFSTLNPSNIHLVTGTTTVGASVNSMPTGFSMIISNAPTFNSVSTLFAKVASTAFGFFMITPSQPISPQGSYSAPVAGDIVYFQHDTFPADLGIVTSATLTGGNFFVNDFPLMGGQSIIKFKTPTATGLVSDAIAIVKGDLMVANVSANPTSDRYAWHIVTTGNAVNNSLFRLDGATGGAPTYNPATTTTFSTIRPNATSTINGSGQVVATTTFSVGDLVFAKVTANADNLNSYAWHIVTTGETIDAGASGALPNTLRLDNGTLTPTFAATGELALLSPGAQGVVTETATTFSFGDIMFTKTTANSGINGAYAFHIVSGGNGGSGGAASPDLRLDNSSANLVTGSGYALTIGTGVKDAAGNPLAAPTTIVFTTGSTGSTNNTPPFVQSSLPQPGNQSFPPNSPLKITFSVDMAVSGIGSATSSTNVALYTSNFGAPGTPVSTTNTYDSSTKTISLAHSALSINTEYVLVVGTTTKSSTSASVVQQYRANFRTASVTDTTPPTVMGSYPQVSATGVSRSVIPGVGFSEDIDPGTVTNTTITLKTTIGSNPVAGTASYNAQGRGASFAPTTQLTGNTSYTLTVVSGSSGVKDLAGVPLGTDYTTAFTTDNVTDTTKPTVSFSNADNFGVAITFVEPLKQGGGPNAADNISNYTLESPVGSSISLGGKTVTYDAGTKTARISGLSLQNGSQFKVTVSTQVQDLAGNGMNSDSAGNVAFGTVADSNATGGQLGPGSGPANDPGMQGMNPIRVTPMVRQAGAISNYHIEFLTSTSTPIDGQIVLTFPSGFDVTNAVAVTAGTQSFCNSDINGPTTGTVTLGTFSNNASAGTVTIPTAGAGTGANAFICLDIAGIINSTIPSTTGYTVDIKTKDTSGNNRTLLDSKTSSSFFLGQAGSNTLLVHVFHDDDLSGSMNGSEGIANVGVFLFSPASGGQSTTTVSGVATFNNIASGDYQVGLQSSTAGSFSFNSAPQSINISGNLTKKFILTATPRTITGTVYGPASTKLDVFASSPNGFTKTTITTNSTSGTSGGVAFGGSNTYSLGVQNNTTYQVGVGPSIPESSLIPGAMMVMPTFNFMPPQPSTVSIITTNITGQNFVLTTATNSIIGSVKDSANAAVSNAGVFCRPVQSNSNGAASGAGTGGQTGTDGSFTLRTIPGVYLCGVMKPGMPSIPDKQVNIASDGTQTPTPLLFKLGASGSSLTITGTIKDDSGNAVPYAGVAGRKVTSTSDTTALGGGTSNFVGGPSDSNGTYTLYVSTGTWVVEAFAPGVGRLGSKTITVGASSMSGQDFSAETLALGTITGTSTQANVGVQGVMIRAETADGSSNNMTPSSADGTYSLKVPAGTYSVKCFFPSIGESSPLTNIIVASSTVTSNHNCNILAPITVTVDVTDGTNPITNAFVDVRDSNGRGNGTNVSVSSTTDSTLAVYTITVPPGTYSVNVSHPAYGPIGTTQTAAITKTLTFTPTSGALFTITGAVAVGSTGLSGVWASLTGTPTGQTNIINAGGQTNSGGAFSISIPAGTYKLRTNKSGYKSPIESVVTVTANAFVGTTTVATAGRTISGSVTLSSVGVSGAFVDANDGNGGFAVAQTDSSGAYSLAVADGTWKVRAHSQGYEAGPTSVVVAGIDVTQALALSAISGFTVKPERQENVTPTSGGFLTNTDIGGNFSMDIPKNALGESGDATVKTQVNTTMPTPSSGSILSKNAITISASDSFGNPIKDLNGKSVTIVVPYTVGDVPAGQEVNLVLGVWNDAAQSYDTLPTAVNTTLHTLTAVVSHFSDFAPLLSSNTTNGTIVAAATARRSSSSGGGGGSVAVSVSTTSVALITSATATGTILAVIPIASTTNTSPVMTTVNTPIAISSYTRTISIGIQGDDVTSLQTFLENRGFLKMPNGVLKGYFGATTKVALIKYQKSVGLPPVGLFGPATKAKVEAESSIRVEVPVKDFTYDRDLGFGSSGGDVSTLQTFLVNKGFLVIPRGQVKGYFGQATQKALIKYQKSVGISAVGSFGPATRAYVNALLK